jgi:MoaA/NifB/PqqE/SkfB family radical SAM enzyme
LKLLDSLKKERGSPFPEARVHYIINRNSYRSLEEVPNWAGKLGIETVTYSPLHPVRGVSREQMLTPEEENSVRLALERAGRKLESMDIEHNRDETLLRYDLGNRIWEKLPCYIAWYHARIRTDGEVTSCGRCGFSFGNLTRQPFGEIWNSPAIRDNRRLLLTREGLAAVQDNCNCNFCCFAKDNMKIHRLFRWISPVVPRRGVRAAG